MKLFGFEIIRADEGDTNIQTFVQPNPTDDIGYSEVVGTDGYIQQNYNGNTSTETTEANHIQQVRDIATYHEVDDAVEKIVSEAIVSDENQDSIKLDLASTQWSEPVKEKVRKSFKKVYNLLDFKTKGHSIFRRWYIDGRSYYHKVIDEKNTKQGLKELRYIDPKKMRRIREYQKTQSSLYNANLASVIKEYFIYNSNGINDRNLTDNLGIVISKDSIAYAHSGKADPTNRYIISFLDKAIAPANKLRTLENSAVVNRLVRAPERRIFYIDVGNLPKGRAEQHMQGIAQRYKTKVTYDTVSGKIKDDRSIMAMTEDYFIPRRNGDKSAEITTLQGQAGQAGAIDELEFFKKQLYKSLNVPLSRMDGNGAMNFGGNGEISKEEADFSKFINRLRVQFNSLFDDLLGTELVLTGVMSIEEWEYERKNVHYDYLKDNYFNELLESDVLATRLGTLAQVEPYVGKYYSQEYVWKNILKLTDEEILDIKKQIAKEKEEDSEAHIPVDQFHQINLHRNMTQIDMDKEIAVNAETEPNPFAESVDNKQEHESVIELNEAMTDLFKTLAKE